MVITKHDLIFHDITSTGGLQK